MILLLSNFFKEVFSVLETFLATLSPMLIMFICILIGFILKKKKLIPESSGTTISKLENFVFVPALIISTFMNYCTVDSIGRESKLILYSTLILALALIIALPLSKAFESKDYYRRNIYKYALAIGNFSFMGNAIVPAILSSYDGEILFKYILYCLPLHIAVYTWGVAIMIPKGEEKQSVFKNLLNPVFISIIIGTVLGLSGIKPYVPSFIVGTLDSLKACMGPLAMVLAGFVIGGYDMKKLIKNKKVYVATILRLIVLPALFVAILLFLRAPDTAIILTLFAFGTPLGLNTIVFPAAYGGDTETGASMAMISHTLCIITIPLMYALLQLIL